MHICTYTHDTYIFFSNMKADVANNMTCKICNVPEHNNEKCNIEPSYLKRNVPHEKLRVHSKGNCTHILRIFSCQADSFLMVAKNKLIDVYNVFKIYYTLPIYIQFL